MSSDKYDDSFETPVLTANKGFVLGYSNECRTFNENCVIFDDFTLDSKYVDFPFMVKSSALKILTLRDKKLDNLYFSYELINRTRIEVLGHARHYISVVQPTKVFSPKTDEEIRISILLQSIEKLVALHQRKCDRLKNVKQALLEKMLPTEKEDTPKIRFKGFTEPWEQRKLGEVSQIIGGGTPNTNNPDFWDGDINWFAPAELKDQRFLSKSQKRITKSGFESSSAKLLPKGTVLFTSRAGIGTTAILTEKACTNQGFQSIVPKDKCLDTYFIYSLTPYLKKYAEIKGGGSTFVEVSGKQMADMLLKLPKQYEEQVIIGTFFRLLDDIITLHQRKCEKLKNIKSALLERMFV